MTAPLGLKSGDTSLCPLVDTPLTLYRVGVGSHYPCTRAVLTLVFSFSFFFYLVPKSYFAALVLLHYNLYGVK